MANVSEQILDVMNRKIEELAQTVKDQGYCLVMPINYNNGLYNFRSQNRFNTVKEKDLGDALTPLIEPFESRGVNVGTYIGNVILFLKNAYISPFAFLFANEASNKSLSENHLPLNILRSS